MSQTQSGTLRTGRGTDVVLSLQMLGMQALLARVVHGSATPLVVIIGLVLIVVGVVMLIRGSVLLGAAAIIVGVLLGGLSVF